jgi:hypothetical protein
MTNFVKTAPVNDIWRFFTASNGKWQWQHLTISQILIAESNPIHDGYEECVADAQRNGYEIQVLPASTKPKFKISTYSWRDR